MSLLPLQIESKEKNPLLRAIAKEIPDSTTPDIQGLISDMQETLTKTTHGIGLAAPQVGVSVRLFIISPQLGTRQTVFINPLITQLGETRGYLEEGCLSLPGEYGKIMRSTTLKITAHNQNGRIFKMRAEGLVAQVIQHEIDHLNGILFKDNAKDMKTSSVT